MTTTVTTSADGRKISAAVPAGETSNPIFVGQDVVVACFPGSGGTMSAQATWSSVDAVNAGTANWLTWDAGSVSAGAAQALSMATAVKFTATTKAGVGEVSR